MTETMAGQAESEKFSRTAFADGPRLLADIGATHARFALQTAPDLFRSVRVLKCDDFEGIVPLLRFYLADHDEVGAQTPPRRRGARLRPTCPTRAADVLRLRSA